jgi:DNA-binding IclR family transcriptional regulator
MPFSDVVEATSISCTPPCSADCCCSSLPSCDEAEFLHLDLAAALGGDDLGELAHAQAGRVVRVVQVAELDGAFLDVLGAEESGELVRLAVVDGDDLTFVAKAQGARRGLRYDPDMGLSVRLSCSSAGHAWLSTLSDEEAMRLVAKQGFGLPKDFGPKAPTTVKALLAYVQAARKRGFSMISEVFAPQMTAMAAPVMSPTGAIGVVTIAGPLVRLTEARMEELSEALLDTAEEIRAASGASAMFKKRA